MASVMIQVGINYRNETVDRKQTFHSHSSNTFAEVLGVQELSARFCWSYKVVTCIQRYGTKKIRLQIHHEFSQQQKVTTSGC